MLVKYYPDTDSVIITTGKGGRVSGTLWDDWSVILTYAVEDDEIITAVEVFDVTGYHLPLAVERGYDAVTGTLTLGEKPVADFRGVDRGEFVNYLQWFDDGSDWQAETSWHLHT